MDDGRPEPNCGGRCGDVPERSAYTLGDGQPGDGRVEVDSFSNAEYVEDNMQVECIC